jgi:hypothetical protein
LQQVLEAYPSLDDDLGTAGMGNLAFDNLQLLVDHRPPAYAYSLIVFGTSVCGHKWQRIVAVGLRKPPFVRGSSVRSRLDVDRDGTTVLLSIIR